MTNAEIFSEGLSHQNILVVGDVMIDSYLWGKVARISPEAPVPIVEVNRREKRLGGAANVALNIRSLGAKPIICSVLGSDDYAKNVLHLMYAHDMDKRGMVMSDDRITTVKSRVIGNNMHIVRVDEETTRPLSEGDQKTLIERVERTLKMMPIGAIIFQDYDKGCLTPEVIEKISEIAHKKHIITTVDPKHRNFPFYRNVTLFKPNLKELKEGLGVEIDESSPEKMKSGLDHAALLLHERQNIEIVLITLSNKGVYYCDFRGEKIVSDLLPAQCRSLSDVSGAGDTVISVATLALAIGLPLADVVRIANMAGGIVCEEVGVVPVDKGRLLQEIAQL